MSLKNCWKLCSILNVLAAVFALAAFLMPTTNRVLLYIFFTLCIGALLASTVIKFRNWRCPRCDRPLQPYGIIKHSPDYKCDGCGAHIEIE